MSTSEFKLRKILEDATFFIRNAEEDETFLVKCNECMDQAKNIILENPRESFKELSAEVIVMFTEVALLTNKRDEDAKRVLDIFFQRFTLEDQYFCRALLAYSTIQQRKILKEELKGDENLKQVQIAYSYIKRVIEIATKPENKQKYQFIIYNASIKTWHIIRSLLKQGWSKNLIEILEKISNLLEEADDSDFNWRCRYLYGLVKAMMDNEKKPEALKILDKLYDLTKKKGECNFQEQLFRNRIHYYKDNNGVLGSMKKEVESGPDKNGFRSLLVIQMIHSGAIPEAQIEKELMQVMQALCPASVTNDQALYQQATKISQIYQDRLAECGRIAVKYNFLQLCENTCQIVARARQGSLRAKVWTEYNKAELILKRPLGEVDEKTGMKLNTIQKQNEDMQRRIEALKILDRVMVANKRLGDADVITEGCYLIWNISLPFLKQSTRQHTYKAFQSAAQQLEQIQSNESLLRICLHLELARYEIDQDFLSKATMQLNKALNIDYSLTLKQIPADLKEDDDPSDFQRCYDKTIKFLLKKLNLKTNLYGEEPESIQDQILLQVENAKTTKNVKMRETLLNKAFKELQEYEEPEFEIKTELNLVEEEIKIAERKFHLQSVTFIFFIYLKQTREKKQRVLIAAEIAKLALEEMIVDLAFKSAKLAIESSWDHQKDSDLVIAQSDSHIIMAKCYVEYLLEEDIEIGCKDLITVDEDQDERQFTNEEKTKFEEWKKQFTYHIMQSVKLGLLVNQSWLVFNASIEFWNNYLPLFKKENYYEIILPEGIQAMQECFDGLNISFTVSSFSSESADYELNKKMEVFSSMAQILARIQEFIGKNDSVIRICDILLQKQLPLYLKKHFFSLKARVTKQVISLSQGVAGQSKAAAKGGNKEQQQTGFVPSKTEIVVSEVLSYLELIKIGNKDHISKAVEVLTQWSPSEQEESELELSGELWCKLGRLAMDINTNSSIKTALYCADMCLKNADKKFKDKNYQSIPNTRLRWYALAQALYGEALHKLIDNKKQEKESQDILYEKGKNHYIEACEIAKIAKIEDHILLAQEKVKYARTCKNQLEQHNDYNKAIELLRKEESAEVVEVLIEYAEWLHRNQYSTQEVEDQLHLAVDVLLDIEPGWDEDEEETLEGNGQDDEQKTRKTGKSRQSRMSQKSQAKTKISRDKSIKKSKVGTQSKKSRASMRSKAMKSSLAKSKKTTTSLTKKLEDEAQPLFLNCSHFDKLIRIHSMLAMISSDSYKQRDYILDAHYFILRLWEQSYQAVNAALFFEQNKKELEELGFQYNDIESRSHFFYEMLTNNDINIPETISLPCKLEDWIKFEIPQQLKQFSQTHEDKLMISKFTFIKPELTFFHLQNILSILEEQYFTLQMLPLLELLKLFSIVVFEDKKIEEIMLLKQARVLINLGQTQKAQDIKSQWDSNHYLLTDEEKKINLENIKGFKDPNDNLKDKYVNFPQDTQNQAFVIQSIRIHETWIIYAEELLKWGEYVLSKPLILEANLHSRILKDQNNYSKTLLMLGTIAFLEGESASSLRCHMLCLQYANDFRIVEQAIEHKFIFSLGLPDTDQLIIKCSNNKLNLPLKYALETVFLLKAILCVANNNTNIDDQIKSTEESYQYIEKFESIVETSGYKQAHIVKLLKYIELLQSRSEQQFKNDQKIINHIQSKLNKSTQILQRVQEILTTQSYYIGESQNQSQDKISHPLLRLLGITKLRIAQTNTLIGILKNSMKLSNSIQDESDIKLDKIVSNFMDNVSKQIQAEANVYKKEMNRYEQSLTILYSAKNLVSPMCNEYQEIMVEIARCRRLLAVKKKHLRGQWRQDAIEVDQVNMNQIQDEMKDRTDQLEEKGLKGEIVDQFIDYKQEALKSFIQINHERTIDQSNQEECTMLSSIASRLSLDQKLLANLSLEYAEARGNLNKEQSFFAIVNYQYAISKEQLMKTYINACTEKHPDILRLRQIELIEKEFPYYSTQSYPQRYKKLTKELKEKSVPFKILSSFYQIDDLKQNLPHSSAYLVLQLSQDGQELYYGMLHITKDRKHNYYVSKINLSDRMQDKLNSMVEKIDQCKVSMMKTPITIEQDLVNLEAESEGIIQETIKNIEEFFKPITQELNNIINPEVNDETAEQQQQQQQPTGKGTNKKDDKKSAPKAGGNKGAKGGELGSYESNLPLPTSEIESLVLLIDNQFESLPLESLQVFSKIPVISRDFNLHLYMKRLQNLGHQAQLHNNQGISKDSLKYIIDPPQPLEDQTQQFVVNELPKLMQNSKWEGVLTNSNHIPSEGEWQRLISQSSLFAYYSMTCLLHKFNQALISDLSLFSKCRAMIILDRMNSYKQYVDRNVLTSKHFLPNEQPKQQAILFSLCGVCSIVTNHWSITPEQNYEILNQLLKTSLTEQIYIGASLRKYKEGEQNQDKKLIYKLNTITYGVPLIRIV